MNTGIDRALSMKLDPISVSPMEHEKMMMNITRKNQKLHFPCRLSFAVTTVLICFVSWTDRKLLFNRIDQQFNNRMRIKLAYARRTELDYLIREGYVWPVL